MRQYFPKALDVRTQYGVPYLLSPRVLKFRFFAGFDFPNGFSTHSIFSRNASLALSFRKR
jgi:hypothetical protein